MNTVIRTGRNARWHVPLAGLTPPVRLPVYMSLSLFVAAVMAVVVVGWTIPVRRQEPPSNAFVDYTAVLPGQPRSAVVGMGFSCNADNRSGTSEFCTRAPANGAFSLVAVTLKEGTISRVSLTVREDRLAIGDLALLWGRPEIRVYGHSVSVVWPSRGVSAEGWAKSRRFSYAIPVQRIAFGLPSGADA